MTTQSVDPAGQHRLSHANGGDSRNPDYWHQFPTYGIPYNMRREEEATLRGDAAWSVVVGSDITLQCEYVAEMEEEGTTQALVRAFDGDGNALAILGAFRGGRGSHGQGAPMVAMDALPTLTVTAHMLFPNHLLMRSDAEFQE